MIPMIVDTAVVVPVNLIPLTDDTDFKSREASVAYNASGMDLVWNFITPAGVVSQTAVTPTTGGDYDWAHEGDAMYSIEIPASGGASINNDTEGVGYFTGICDGVLAWRGPSILFGKANAINALFGLDRAEVDLLEIGGVSQSATDLKDFADAGYDPATNSVSISSDSLVVCQLEAAMTSSAGSAVRFVAWLEKGGQFVDLDTVDNSANCTIAVREHGAGSDLFTALTATEPDSEGRFELSQSSPGFTDDRLYICTVTIEENGNTWISTHVLPVFG